MRLIGNKGTWVGAGTISYLYTWLHATNPGASGIGPTGASYLLRSSDVGYPIEFIVEATDANGTTRAASQALGPVLGLEPNATAAPTITGAAMEGLLLVGSPGTWSGTSPITFAYQWQRYDANTDQWVDIASAINLRYRVTMSDIGSPLRLQVTATNVVDTTVAYAQTDSVTGRPPACSVAPSLTGTPVKGQRLTGSRGSWTGTSGITYQYRWLRRTSPTDVHPVEVTGAQGISRTMGAADVGKYVTFEVIATNLAGVASRESDPPLVITAT